MLMRGSGPLWGFLAHFRVWSRKTPEEKKKWRKTENDVVDVLLQNNEEKNSELQLYWWEIGYQKKRKIAIIIIIIIINLENAWWYRLPRGWDKAPGRSGNALPFQSPSKHTAKKKPSSLKTNIFICQKKKCFFFYNG